MQVVVSQTRHEVVPEKGVETRHEILDGHVGYLFFDDGFLCFFGHKLYLNDIYYC